MWRSAPNGKAATNIVAMNIGMVAVDANRDLRIVKRLAAAACRVVRDVINGIRRWRSGALKRGAGQLGGSSASQHACLARPSYRSSLVSIERTHHHRASSIFARHSLLKKINRRSSARHGVAACWRKQ